MPDLQVAAVMGLFILIASMLSVELGISVAVVEILIGGHDIPRAEAATLVLCPLRQPGD